MLIALALFVAPSFDLIEIWKGDAYVIDSGLTAEDCAFVLKDHPSLLCKVSS